LDFVAIDLRSDTVTRPDDGMRQAMAHAEVGDDVLGDDPTVHALQQRIAKLLGKEAALFTPTGTMANQLALRSQTSPGDEVLLDVHSHVLNYESGAGAAHSGVQFRTFDAPRGGFTSDDVRTLRRPPQYRLPRTRMVEMENTHNHRGGEIFELERMRDVWAWACKEGLRVHLDGARLWNASVATGVALAGYAACAHTVSVCFSKGLGAPVGSALASDAETVLRAHRLRNMFGGGMRQAGILAAAALYALDHNVERLHEDHQRAATLAQAVEECRGLRLARHVETNILIVEVTDAHDTPEELVDALREHGLLASVWEARTIRLLTHLDVDDEDIARACELLRALRG
jgi:threonine aldolase